MASPSSTSAVTSGAVPISPSTGCGWTVYDPGATANADPSSAVTTDPTGCHSRPSRTVISAPTTGLGAQAGSGGFVSTGHTGPAVAWISNPVYLRQRRGPGLGRDHAALLRLQGHGPVREDRVQPGVPVDAASPAVAPTHVDLDEERTVSTRHAGTTSYQSCTGHELGIEWSSR